MGYCRGGRYVKRKGGKNIRRRRGRGQRKMEEKLKEIGTAEEEIPV